MPQALYFKPTYERLRDKIHAAAPDLDVVLYDEEGKLWHLGREVTLAQVSPEYFWIHSELFASPRLKDYFKLMLACPSIRWLHTINTGLDLLPYSDVLNKGVTITNNHAQAIAIAEYVFAQVLAYYHDISELRSKQREQVWKAKPFREIHGSHWLLVGFGEIGQAIAKRAKAFGATVTAVRRQQNTAGLADAVVTPAQLPQVLPQADVVVIAAAANASSRNMVDAAFLQAMKDKSVFINIARGDLVVEEALKQALDVGKPEFAILDVLKQEPPAQDSWVWQHPRVALTPHSSNAGSGMRQRSEQNFLTNLANISAGRPLQNVVSQRDIV